MCWGFISSSYAAIQFAFLGVVSNQKCKKWPLFALSGMRLVEALLWYSIEYSCSSMNHIISSWLLPVMFISQLVVNYRCTQAALPIWWKSIVILLGIGLFYYFHGSVTTTKKRDWIRSDKNDLFGIKTEQLVLGGSALPGYFSACMSIFIYRPQSNDPSTLHWLFHSTFLLVAFLAAFSDYVTPTLCTISVLQTWILL